MVRYPGKGGIAIKVPHRDVLARERVRYVGQEIALVVATSAAAAQDAAELIEIDYRDLPARGRRARRRSRPARRSCTTTCRAISSSITTTATRRRPKRRSRSAAHVTRLEARRARASSGNPMEPKACAGRLRRGERELRPLRQHAGHGHDAADSFAAITGVPAEQIRVHAQDVGGGFGIRSQAYPEYCALMLAAKSARPAGEMGRLALRDASSATITARGATLDGELALDARRQLPRRCASTGSCNHRRLPVADRAAHQHAQPGDAMRSNVYRIPALYGRHRLALTNTTPTTAYRGAGRPNVSYLVERLVDEAARETGIDRIELRRRNFIPKDAFPYKTPTGSTYDSGDSAGYSTRRCEHADWAGFERRRAKSAARGKLRGIGCAMFVEPSGGGSAPQEEAAIRFGESGNAIAATCSPGRRARGTRPCSASSWRASLGIPAGDDQAPGERSARPGAAWAAAPSARAR